MLKVLHTADWHLGKRLDFYSRLPEQALVMDEICRIADESAADLILVAGDLFDTVNPPIEAIELFYKTLKRLSNDGKRPVIAIAGNHDNPDRIDAPNPLAKECGILLFGNTNTTTTLFGIENSFEVSKADEGFVEIKLASVEYPIRVIASPYMSETRMQVYLGEEDREKKLNEVIAEKWNQLATTYCDEQGVNLLMTHLYMAEVGEELEPEPEGEKPIKIGNADIIYTNAIPKQMQYTALGHLHRNHWVDKAKQKAAYSGSPIAYSFSEDEQTKYVNLLSLEPNQPAQVEKIALTAGKTLYRKKFDSITKAVEWLEQHQDHLVELTIESETFLTVDERKQLYAAHPGIIFLIPVVKNDSTDANENSRSKVNLEQDIHGLFNDYFKSREKGQAPSEELLNVFKEILSK
jgi:exonuclease SbcD